MPTKPKGHRLRKGRVSETGRIYLITTIVHNRKPVFSDLYPGRLLVQTIRTEQSHATTLAYAIMPDHFHWLMQLADSPDLSTVVATIKSVSAHRINHHLGQQGNLWQAGFHDHAVRKEEDIQALARYIVASPLRAGLVDNIGDFPLWDALWV